MTLLAVKPESPQPDIGSILDVLAHHRPIEFDCASSPVLTDPFEVDSRHELEERLVERYPFRPTMEPITDATRVAIQIRLTEGPPIWGEGDSMANALDSFLTSALSYIDQWERSLRFGTEHQKYWGWVYRLLLCGDDAHILATLLNEPID